MEREVTVTAAQTVPKNPFVKTIVRNVCLR
jgi:hypothetical protein